MQYHNPVLLPESTGLLRIEEGKIYVDVTYGGGGHTAAILRHEGKAGRVIAFDKDSDAHQAMSDEARMNIESGRLTLIQSDFRHLLSSLKSLGVMEVHGILADLGLSSRHLDAPERGFSFRFDAELDMRMDRRQELTAKEVVNTYSEADLVHILRSYGELPQARRMAAAIVRARARAEVCTTHELVRVAGPCIPRQQLNKHLAMLFQAIRMEVNSEMQGLEELLQGSLQMLAPGGRLVVISYHSLEDRKVKNFMRSGNTEGKEEKDFFGNSLSPWTLVTRKAITPTDEEIHNNPRARSAKLRAAEKR